jgi:hypothetical protein
VQKTLFGYSVWLTNELKNERPTAGFGIMLQARKFGFGCVSEVIRE